MIMLQKGRDRLQVLKLHALLCERGLEADESLGTELVSMLVEVGSISDAQQASNKLVSGHQRAWSAIIRGFVNCGKPEEALSVFRRMQQHTDWFAIPNVNTFIALFKASAQLQDFQTCTYLHAEATRVGILESDIYAVTSLVDMYAKIGLLARAHEVFSNFPARNVVIWTTLIAGYAEHGLGLKALECFEQMQLDDVSPNAVTYVCCLKACGSIGDIDIGLWLHGEIERKKLLDKNLFVGSALVDMYVKLGFLFKAQEVFNKLTVRNIFSWNALLVGYLEHGKFESVLDCYEQMQIDYVSPDAISFVWTIKACGNLGSIEKGQEIHAEFARKGLIHEDLVSSSLIDMYAKCGLFSIAVELFNDLSNQDMVSWTALISGYAEHGYGEEALKYFELMKLDGVCPDAIMYVYSLKACGSLGSVEKGEDLHAEIESKGMLYGNLPLLSSVVDMYAKCGSLVQAREVFNKTLIRDAVLWTTLITGYSEHGHEREALKCYERMRIEGISPTAVTYVASLKACGFVGSRDKGQEIHAEIEKSGLTQANILIGNTLIDMYAKCGVVSKAQQAFEKLKARDIVSWNALISGYADHGHGEETLECFVNMQAEGICPDAVTVVSALKACSVLGAQEKGFQIHADVTRRGLMEEDLLVGTTLLYMYSNCGSPDTAKYVFDKIPGRDVVLWNSLISSYSQVGKIEDFVYIVDRMLHDGIKPDPVTFISIFNVCSRLGLYSKCETYFESMTKDYGIVPSVEHHTCMVDLLGHAGWFDKAEAVIDKMPWTPSLEMCRAVLGACSYGGNLELAETVFKKALCLEK